MNFDLATAAGSRAVIVVEGMSDRVALETLAERRGIALRAQGISIVHLDGATNIGRFLDLFGPRGLDVRLAGLCDAAEEGHFRRALERAGVGSPLSRADMEALGFYVCGADLEEELIRALGVAAVERVIQAQGEIRSLRIFQQMPAWQGQKPREAAPPVHGDPVRPEEPVRAADGERARSHPGPPPARPRPRPPVTGLAGRRPGAPRPRPSLTRLAGRRPGTPSRCAN